MDAQLNNDQSSGAEEFVLDDYTQSEISKMVLNALNDLKNHFAEDTKNHFSEDTVDEDDDTFDGTPTKDSDKSSHTLEDIKQVAIEGVKDLDHEGSSIEPLKMKLEEQLNGVVLDRVREILQKDEHILHSMRYYKMESPFDVLTPDVAEFFLPHHMLETWIGHHQLHISANFVRERTYNYIKPEKDKATNQVLEQPDIPGEVKRHRLTYECHCAGKVRIRKERTKGGVSGKTRLRKPSMKQGCKSRIFAELTHKTNQSGLLEKAYHIRYLYQHNHSLGSLSDIGTRQNVKQSELRLND
ncbi:hypothetical protein BGZ76_009983 [Entomortierella beljakovae]|nr:hypothetical protein BGZ76_009983 [Entomortierella beljakovae]